MSKLSSSDMTIIMEELESDWQNFKNSRILLLGGTGFIGKWITNCFLKANSIHNLNLEVVILTRSPINAANRNPELCTSNVELIELDLSNETNVNLNLNFDFFIHGATDSTYSYASTESKPHSSVHGANLILNSLNSSSFTRGVHLSSGAVFPKQGITTIGQPETENSEIFENLSGYGKAKYKTELLFKDNFVPNEFEVSNPRLFTFYGPGIPLDKHFAIGNFLRNAMNKEPIVVNGNPDTVRSYMHPIDLVIWIIKLLLNPSTSTLNFGSDAPITMANLASRINEITGNKGIEFIGKSEPVSVYFPSTIKARGHLKVKQSIKFGEGIERWISWLNTQT
jgi:dTDP-glucose 4,6-dehydratase